MVKEQIFFWLIDLQKINYFNKYQKELQQKIYILKHFKKHVDIIKKTQETQNLS
jgi:hypothetical protein